MHHQLTFGEVAAVQVLPFGRERVCEDGIGVARSGHFERRAGTDGNDLHGYVVVVFERRDKDVQQPRILGGGRRGP